MTVGSNDNITSQTFAGDNSTVAFTLNAAATTASVIVSINGTVQTPTTAYAVSSTTLTFTEAPASGDAIEVRRISTLTTVTNITNGLGDTISVDANGVVIPCDSEAIDDGLATTR